MAGVLVSVCVPARDHAPFVREAVTSALGQDVELEVLVGDDASSDATAAVVASVGDPRVRVLRHPRRVGVAANRDALRAAARGSYVAWLDADDAYEPGMLARQVAVLEAEPRVGLVHGRAQVVDEQGRPLSGWPAPFSDDAVEPSGTAFGHLLAANEIVTSTVVVRGAVDARLGPTPRLRSSSDWAMWLALALRADVAYTAAPVARYRQHAATITRATAGRARLCCDIAVARHVLGADAALLRDPAGARAMAAAALCAKAVLHAGERLTAGRRAQAARAAALAVRLAPAALRADAAALLVRTARGDALGAFRASRALLARSAQRLDGTRFGARVAALAAGDDEWEAGMVRAAAVVRAVVPRDASVGAIAKWDPTLLALSGRRGRNVPDRRLLPDGYPADGAAAIAHLDALRADGLTHLVVPRPSSWWLEHYAELAAELRERHVCLRDDADCAVFALEPAR